MAAEVRKGREFLVGAWDRGEPSLAVQEARRKCSPTPSSQGGDPPSTAQLRVQGHCVLSLRMGSERGAVKGCLA